MKLAKLVCLLLLALALVVPLGASAQAACPGVTIRNDSATSLDSQAICSAAQPWINQGLQVFVYVSDADPQTEDDWFAIRDEVEIGWGIYDKTNDTFNKNALALELTTNTSHPWGHDIAFGERLFGTPLDNDNAILQTEGRLKNYTSSGNISQAVGQTLTDAYQIAFPPVPTRAPVQAPPPQQSDPRPAPIPQPQPRTEAPRPVANVDLQPIGSGILLILLVVGLVFAGVRFGPPLFRHFQSIQKKREYLNHISKQTAVLLQAAGTLFKGENVEESALWKWFIVFGGDKYPELMEQVRSWIQNSQAGLRESFELFDELEQMDSKERKDIDNLIKAYEAIYVTLVGTGDTIQRMSAEEFKAFIDPMNTDAVAKPRDSSLVQQLEEVSQLLVDQPLKVVLQTVRNGKIDAYGVFGYAQQVKQAIAKLAAAKTEAPKALSAAHVARERTAQVTLPAGLTAARALTTVDARISEAESENQAERWLNVAKLANEAIVLCQQLNDLLPQAAAKVATGAKRFKEVDTIVEQGFRLEFLNEAKAEANRIIAALFDRISQGDVEAAKRSVQNLDDHSTTTLDQAKQRVDLRNKNTQRLVQLAKEVAEADGYRIATAQPAWKELQGYPDPNWKDLANNFTYASSILTNLFDDPANAEDLASTISRLNSLESQKFTDAENMLNKAFADLADALANLKALVDRLAYVTQIKNSIQRSLIAVGNDIAMARERRDRDNRKIDRKVDELITKAVAHLNSAERAANARAFTVAQAAVTEARNLANQAYSSADEQAKAIDTLYGTLEAMRERAGKLVATALTDNAALKPAAQNPTTSGLCAKAQDALHAAKQTEAAAQDKEDTALAAALQDSINAYQTAASLAEEARKKVAADKQEYDSWYSRAQQAVQSAESATSSANRYVSDSDAGRAGSTSLQQALGMIPSVPSYGADRSAYQRVLEQAERAASLAGEAERQAKSRIREVEEAREAERRRQEAERQRKLAQEAAERAAEQRRKDAAEAAERARRSSSMGISSSSRSSSSMGSSRRR